jgi:hypothetical protein
LVRQPILTVLTAAALAVLAGACDDDSPTADPSTTPPPASTAPTPVTTAAATPTTPTPTTAPPTTAAPPTTVAAIEVVDVFEGVDYYGACGNETVVVDGTQLYPLLPIELDHLDESMYPLPGEREGMARVMPPGPGDDVGTMVLYSDGVARFQSDSGRVIWLTQESRVYNWVC